MLLEEKAKVEQQSEELRLKSESIDRMNAQLAKLSLVASGTDNSIIIADKNAKLEWVNEGQGKG